jgi:hypothetical protein
VLVGDSSLRVDHKGGKTNSGKPKWENECLGAKLKPWEIYTWTVTGTCGGTLGLACMAAGQALPASGLEDVLVVSWHGNEFEAGKQDFAMHAEAIRTCGLFLRRLMAVFRAVVVVSHPRADRWGESAAYERCMLESHKIFRSYGVPVLTMDRTAGPT